MTTPTDSPGNTPEPRSPDHPTTPPSGPPTPLFGAAPPGAGGTAPPYGPPTTGPAGPWPTPPAAPGPSAPPPAPPSKKPNPLTRRVGIPVWAIAATVVVLIAALAAAGTPDDGEQATGATVETSTTQAERRSTTTASIAATTASTASTVKPTTTTARPTTTTAAPAAPATYSGAGTAVVEVKLASTHFILNATHSGSSNFIVKPVSSTGDQGSSLINEIGAYTGKLLVEDPTKIVALSVKADGAWRFEFVEPIPAVNVNVARPGETYTGQGKDVIGLVLPSTGLIKAAFTATKANFIVRPYDDKGNRGSSLVNEIAPWSGEVIIRNNIVLLDVIATGQWTMTLSG